MKRYKIFLITGETVEVLAESVKVMIDEHGHVNRYDFIENNDAPICEIQPNAIIYSEYIMGWAELPEIKENEYWIEVDTNQYACHHCNRCFSIVAEDNVINEYKYCPNCGTRMESVQLMSESEDKS